jgi:predicted RNA-binding protein with PUA-like domain
MPSYWLMKSEPEECSIDDALKAPKKTVPWTGVRNYQARNFMRDAMRPGDGVLFYHSSCAEPGIAGLAEVASTAYPDATQFDPAKASTTMPRPGAKSRAGCTSMCAR